MIRRRPLIAAGLLAPFVARAQAGWSPSRPLRFVVPYVAGGSTDIAARIVAERMTETLGQTVVVENRGGSGGNIGGDVVAKAPADGHTLLMGTTGLLTTNQHIYASMPFDTARDFAPVSMAYTSDMVIVVTNRLPVRTLREFVDLAKQRPGAFSFGSSGHGASTHTAAELFKIQAGIDIVHVPYRGSGAAMNDLVSGNIEMMLVQIAATTGNIAAGQIRALAVTGPQRHPLLPQIETVTEAGWPGATATSWGCVMTTSGTPPAAIARLNQSVRAAIADPAARSRMANAGVDGQSSSVEELAAFLRSETEKWGRVVREARIRVD